MIWPLEGIQPVAPSPEGSFGARRRFDCHTGVDLYCPLHTRILAMESGIVVKIEDNFTGPGGDSSWWNTTSAVLVEGASGVIVYGEVRPLVRPGQFVEAGETIAVVDTSVLKKDKGKPMTMLHLELYEHGARETVWWMLDEEKPAKLLDATILIEGQY